MKLPRRVICRQLPPCGDNVRSCLKYSPIKGWSVFSHLFQSLHQYHHRFFFFFSYLPFHLASKIVSTISTTPLHPLMAFDITLAQLSVLHAETDFETPHPHLQHTSTEAFNLEDPAIAMNGTFPILFSSPLPQPLRFLA